MTEQNVLYPLQWGAIAREVKEANDWCCQLCGLRCRRPGEFYLGRRYELTVAHLDHGYFAPVTTVAALCVVCHLKLDAPHSWVARLRWQRLRALAAGQLELSY